MTILVNQGDLADLLGVDRGTVHALQRQGMPYTPGGRGKPNTYDAPVCMYWRYGLDIAKRRGHPNVAAPTAVLVAYARNLGDDPFDFWYPRALDLARRAGATKPDAPEYVARALAVAGRQPR